MKEDGSVQLIRRAETPEDYFATLDLAAFKTTEETGEADEKDATMPKDRIILKLIAKQ